MSKRKRGFVVALLMIAALAIGLITTRKISLKNSASYSQAVYSIDGTLLRLTLAADQQYRVWTPLASMNPRLAEAVLLYEDRWYRWHVGFNPISLLRGAWATYAGDSRRGASTITMQLARRLYGIDSRAPAGKLRQIAAALYLEARYTKPAILEAYLNLAPYGSNIEGAGAASLIYFGKRAADLSLPEALALAVIPQNPNRRGAAIALTPPTDDGWPRALGAARGRLWATWQRQHPTSAGSAISAEIALPLKLRAARQLPFAAPHAVQALLQQSQHSTSAEPETTLALHAPTQAALERAIAQFLQNRKPQGLSNAAALLIDAPTGEVRALVGSANYFDTAISGQVNAASAKRSPGSTLKPFIYGLALDQGVLHPRSVLKDAPTSFGPYSPENFDGRFEGPITAQDALIRSRNIPAVSVAARLANPNLYEFLKQSGVTKLQSEAHYGLALALGGGELSMEELAALYGMLANGGELKPLSYRISKTAQTGRALGRQMLSPEAAWVTLEMLRANPRPDTGQPAFPAVAWKTGTSWGFRDAWTAGVFGRYVLVVWVGNFDGSANPALVGVQTAAPLFFNIVDSLRSQGLVREAAATPAPRGLARVPVCAASGDLPNAWCKDLANTWFIPGKSPIKVSNLHRALHIEPATGKALCAASANSREEVFEYWPSDMLQLFAQAGMPRRIPPNAPRCNLLSLSTSADAPLIVSPLRGASYVLRISRPVALTLKANSARRGAVYWFVDSGFVGTAPAGKELAWQPAQAGRYQLSAVDEQGGTDTREVVVEFAP